MRLPKFFLPLALLALSFGCSLPTAPTPSISSVASGTLLFEDDFSDPSRGWDQIATSQGRMGNDGGVYRMVVDSPNFIFWSTPAQSFADARIEVDTAAIGGSESNRAGIACRVNGDQFYFFIISSDGYFAIGLAQAGTFTLLGQDQMAFSTNIKTGLAVNHLRADCSGATLAFYINGFPVGQVNDSTLTNGEVGLLAGTFETGGVDIVFDKFIVIQP